MARAAKKQPILTNKRLRLRPFRGNDVKAMHDLYGDADNLRHWSTPPSPSLDATRRMMRWHVVYRPANYVIWAVEETKSGKVIGMINYHHRNLREKRVDVGWLILPQHQGKGYMTEAGRALLGHLFDDLGVHKVEALILPANRASIALARAPGVSPGGRLDPRPLVGERQVA